MEINLMLINMFYPGWEKKVYHGIVDKNSTEFVYTALKRYGQFLNLCFKGNLPGYESRILDSNLFS